ncbi:LysR family transcriptional regulator [Streptomyces sp. NBC_00464]|uniref:LysR family transcriptional regulator n=1 Tax=Streptomyces sp. NBC_00464 TaxID=2975751 RepID=UPI002E16DFE0
MQDFSRLLALMAVAETGSISAAASKLGYTPPALSQQMAKLEREARVQLLVRHRRGARLTAAGELLVRRAREIEAILRATETDLVQFLEVSEEQIRIGTFTTGGIHLLPPVLAELRRRHTRIALSLQEFDHPDGLGPLGDGDIDLLLTSSYIHGRHSPVPAGLSSEVLLEEELLLVAHEGHPLTADSVPLHWTALAGFPLIIGRRGLADRETLEALFASRAMAPPVVAFETANSAMACALASSGVGVACVPRTAVEASTALISTRPFAAQPLKRVVNLLWRSSDTTPLVRKARCVFRETFARSGGAPSARPAQQATAASAY